MNFRKFYLQIILIFRRPPCLRSGGVYESTKLIYLRFLNYPMYTLGLHTEFGALAMD